MHHPTDRIIYTTAFVTPVVEQIVSVSSAPLFEVVPVQTKLIKTLLVKLHFLLLSIKVQVPFSGHTIQPDWLMCALSSSE